MRLEKEVSMKDFIKRYGEKTVKLYITAHSENG